MIPLSVPNLAGRELEYIKKCIDSNWVSSSGGFVNDFEKAICRYVKTKYAVACVNGTSGLQIGLSLCGVERGDEVIVPTLTFIAPVNVVRYLGAEPVFMDCDSYMNMDPRKLEDFCLKECRLTNKGLINKSSGKTIKAVVPVHVFGNPCDMVEINRIARKFHLKVVEDATESLGAYYTAGKYAGKFSGTVSDVGVYSFNGNKIITTGGGGMIVTGNKAMAKKAKYLTEQAKDDPVRCVHNEIGYNFRLTNLQAALGIAQLEQLDKFIKNKKRNYLTYRELLKNISGLDVLGIPTGTSPNYWFYSLAIKPKKLGMTREELMHRLQKNGIQTRPIWHLNHLQRPYRKNQAYKIETALKFWKEVLNVPSSSSLEIKQVRYVTSVIRSLSDKK